jgi:hypothetical protein
MLKECRYLTYQRFTGKLVRMYLREGDETWQPAWIVTVTVMVKNILRARIKSAYINKAFKTMVLYQLQTLL